MPSLFSLILVPTFMPPWKLHKSLTLSAMTCVKYNRTATCSNSTGINSTNTNATSSNVTCSYVNDQCIKGEYNATLTWRTTNISATITKYTVLWGPYHPFFKSVKDQIGKQDLPAVSFS